MMPLLSLRLGVIQSVTTRRQQPAVIDNRTDARGLLQRNQHRPVAATAT